VQRKKRVTQTENHEIFLTIAELEEIVGKHLKIKTDARVDFDFGDSLGCTVTYKEEKVILDEK
jgi:hypothetical protein